jgi:hypothetical protein
MTKNVNARRCMIASWEFLNGTLGSAREGQPLAATTIEIAIKASRARPK